MSAFGIYKGFLSALALTAAFAAGSANAQSTSSVPLAVPAGAASAAVPVGGGGSVPAPTIMIVDGDRILQQAKASQTIQLQLSGLQQSFQKEFSAKNTELENDQTQLQTLQRTLPADQFEERRHAFVTKAENTQKDADSRKQALTKAASEAIDKVKRALLEVVGGLAQERHANLVLLKSTVILLDPAYDVTEEALRRLDQKLSSVQVSLGPTAAAVPAKN